VGGVDPEPIADVKLFAPSAIRRDRQRAITAADYADLAGRVGGVQRAAADLRWTGAWYEVHVGVDPVGGGEEAPALIAGVADALFPVRRIGHDLRVMPAPGVPIDLALRVCVAPHALRAHVLAALLDLFGNRDRAGRRGFFHPDRLSFGDDIRLSALVALGQQAPGVESIEVIRLERLHEGDSGAVESGRLELGPLEIARLDNDRTAPEHGRLTIELRGGR
jgi:predicted phage baseplate assembly protein